MTIYQDFKDFDDRDGFRDQVMNDPLKAADVIERQHAQINHRDMMLYDAWVVIANAYDGCSDEWKGAAGRWRDAWVDTFEDTPDAPAEDEFGLTEADADGPADLLETDSDLR